MPYTLSVPSTTLSPPTSDSAKPFTLYNLTISTPLRTTTLPKRYSDFVALNDTLTSAVGTAPPTPLPSKSWFTRTVNNPKLTEDRRAGLEAYVQAIEKAANPRWRDANEWRAFLGFPPGPSRRNSTPDSRLPPQVPVGLSPSAWLDLHASLKTQLQEARSHLARREAPSSSAAMQHEASASAKRCLVKSNTLILRLEEGLKGLSVGDGEIRRRRDLVGRARKEREGLEALLNAWAVTRSSAASEKPIGGTSGTSVSNVKKDELFSGASRPSPLGESPGKMPGAFPISQGGRVLGGPARETDRTRDKNNQEVLMLQKQIMQAQDMDFDELAAAVRRMKELGIGINEELVEQQQLLDILDQDVDRVSGKLNVAKKRIRQLN